MNNDITRDRSPSDLTEREMEVMAEHLENYLELLEDVFIIPDNIKGSEKTVKQAITKTHELIDRLRKGDRRVFKDDDDCDPV